jgi:hypothetical protein
MPRCALMTGSFGPRLERGLKQPMSDLQIKGPFSTIFLPVAAVVAKHQSLPVSSQIKRSAYSGAFLLGLCGYIAMTLGPDVSIHPDNWMLGCAFVLLLVVVGSHSARSSRDLLGAIFTPGTPIAGYAASMKWALGRINDLCVRGFCFGVGSASVVRFCLAIRDGGASQKAVIYQFANTKSPGPVSPCAGTPVIYSDNRPVTRFRPTRSGKSVSIGITNLLSPGGNGRGVSLLSLDPKGQHCAVTTKWRSGLSTYIVLNLGCSPSQAPNSIRSCATIPTRHTCSTERETSSMRLSPARMNLRRISPKVHEFC